MKKRLLIGYLRGKAACKNVLDNFINEEKGAADIVAILLIIVILIAVAAIFRTQLIGIVTGVFEKLAEALGI